ncbi:MAG: Holliday junction resolvase RuvX [Eubacteriales bacterium]|nr:Holliday junction resolvase RuvX [Eubacteriales bacterium]
MRILAIDYGQRRLGLAMCDPLGITAQALETYSRKDPQRDLEYLSGVVKEYGVDTIVLGWPRNMNGTEGATCAMVGEFAHTLEEHFGTAVRLDFFDERLSSSMAERMLLEADMSRKKRKGVIDKVAASVILQGYMDSGAYKIRRELPWKTTASLN